MKVPELIEIVHRVGSVRKAATKAECSHTLLFLCIEGKREVSPEIAAKLRAA